MNKDSFLLTNKRIIGEASVAQNTDNQPRYVDTGSPILMVAYYTNENKREMERLCLRNIGLNQAIIHRFIFVHGEENIWTDVYDILRPGDESEWISPQIFGDWFESLSVRDKATVTNMLPSTGGSINASISVMLNADCLRLATCDVRLTTYLRNDEITFELVDPQAYANLN